MNIFYFKHNKYNKADPIKKTLIHFYELTFLLHGQMTYLINDQTIALHSGDIIYVRPENYRERSVFSDCNYVSFNFYTDSPPDLPQHITGCITNEIMLLISASFEIYSTLPDQNDFSSLDLLLQCIIKQLHRNLYDKKLSPLTIRIKEYILKHLDEKITLDSVSKEVFFSPVYCSSLFKKETGRSIIEYVIDERIRRAKNLIIEGMRPKDASELSGFSDFNYFCRVFKKRTNYTPTQYQKTTLPP